MANNDYMLSTIDNPFNPFHDYDSWLMYDIEKGYYSCNKLGRIVNFTEGMTEKEMDAEISRAIDAIVDNDFTGTYIRRFANDIVNPVSIHMEA